MKILELIPRQGIPHIQFGMMRNEVREIMEKEYSAEPPYVVGGDTDCYFKNSLQFTYEKDQTLSFIEVKPDPVEVKILGINTWEISGEKLLEYLSEIDMMNEKISEGGSNPIFHHNIITLWDLDEQYDHFGGYKFRKWGAIGIGDDRYYKAICELYE